MRRALFTAIVGLVLSAGVLPATAASAGDRPQVRYYEGPTSEGGRLGIRVVVSDGVARLSLLLIEGPYTCEDGTEGEIDTGVGWGSGLPVVADQQLDLSENWQVVAFMVSGRLGAHRGAGTLTFLLPGLTVDEQAQVCTLGEATWTVERTAGEDFPFRPDVLVRSAGRTITMGGATGSERTTVLAQADDRSIRRYHGRTSLGRGMAARTQRVDTGIELLGLSWGFELPCDDGTEFGGGYRAMIDSPMVIPPGRLDLDVGPGLGETVHLHGELDAHAGSGTLEMIWPVITDDLQAQLCKSGEQTWELWRTDAGY